MSEYHLKVIVDIPVAQLQARGTKALRRSRLKLKQIIVQDTNKNVPIGKGTLRTSALRWAAQDNDWIIWDTPYAHFQHTGRVMVGTHSHSPWAKHGETKVYTTRNLSYRQGGSEWWPKTLKARKNAWMEGAKKFFKEEFR